MGQDRRLIDRLLMLISIIINNEQSSRNYNAPGPRLADLIFCYELYTSNRDIFDYNVFYSHMTPYIEKYAASLHDVERARLAFNLQYGEPDQGSAPGTLSKHVAFLTMLHEDNELLSTELMTKYPLGWSIVDADWCKWTTLLK